MRHLLAQRRLAVLVCAAGLLLKLLVPTGYMVNSDHGRLSIISCTGLSPGVPTMDMPGIHSDMTGDEAPQDHGKAETPCAFAALSAAATHGAVDQAPFAIFIAFVMAAGLRPCEPPARSRRTYLRPPLRGPPAGP